MGIEHDQLDWLRSAYLAEQAGAPRPDLPEKLATLDQRWTPNQHAAQAAVGLWANLPGAVAYAAEAFDLQNRYGHQAMASGGYSCEQFAPDPHTQIWLAGTGGVLWWALKHPARTRLLELARSWWRDHLALLGAFWTPGGPCCACSRALAKPGQALLPNWALDGQIFALAEGLLTKDLLNPPGDWPWMMLRELAAELKRLRTEARKIDARKVKLAIPIRKWEESNGGFLAAMTEEVPMNDRLAWLRVDGDGEIIGSSRTLDDLSAPATEPEIFGKV